MRQNTRHTHRRAGGDGASWLNFSDLMSSLLLIFILIMFYIMYQYFDMYEIKEAEIARQQYNLDQAQIELNDKTAKLSEAEQQMIAQQIRLNAAQAELDDAEAVLASQRTELANAQRLLTEKEGQITAQATQLNQQQTTLTAQQQQLAAQQLTLDDQRMTMAQQQMTMDAQSMKLAAQQEALEKQQLQIEALVGMKTRIIASLSSALRAANISAQVDPTNGSIALESDVMFETNKYELSERGKQFIDQFLPVYLDVLLSDEYGPYVTEIIIEGHTDSTGDYISNLKLSQQRALSVATYVLADSYGGISAKKKERMRELATANGRSESDPVRTIFGLEDMEASRRVVFKFRMTDEQMIQQLKYILEN
ncbi:MAG: OmpA family protein [bacterium]